MDLLRAIPLKRQLRTAVQCVRIRVIPNEQFDQKFLRFALVRVGGIIFSLNCVQPKHAYVREAAASKLHLQD